MGIDWKKLKDNKKGRGFEALAIEYLKSNFRGKWQQTKQTRDGNKDAISIIYINKEAWAEAKYTEKERLSRFRLDATIVSAIIGKDKVVELIFITNSQIDINTQNSIKNALSNSMGESFRVSFRTKEDIEFWLYSNPDIFERYFQSPKEVLSELQFRFNRLRFTSSIKFYSNIRHSISFEEALDTLLVDDTYIMMFSLFSPTAMEDIMITINSNKFTFGAGKNTISIRAGNNTVNVKVKCISPGRIYRQPPILTIEGVYGEIENTDIDLMSSINLVLGSQNIILRELQLSLERFKLGSNSRQVFLISGDGGMGKSILLEQLIRSDALIGLDIIFQSFTHSSNDNRIVLVNIVLLIFFYYLPSTEVNETYLKEIIKKNGFISSYLLELVRARDTSIDDLALKMLDYARSGELFPDMVKLNKKVLILDDLHKLDEVSRGFLFNLVSDINNSSLNCFIVLSGRTQLWSQKEFMDFVKANSFVPQKLQITVEDVFANLTARDFNVDKKVLSHIVERATINAIFILKLIEFLIERQGLFNSLNLEAKHVVINQFVSDGDYKNKIISFFSGLAGPQADLLNVVYFSISGIAKNELKEDFHGSLRNDLAHLITYTEGRFVPFHDIYQEIYRKHYDPVPLNVFEKYLKQVPSEFDDLRNTLVFYEDFSELNKVLQAITSLQQTHQFYAIQYILDPVFGSFANVKRQIKSIPRGILFKLHFSYAVSVANCSRSNSGRNEFKILYRNIKTLKESSWDEGKTINEVLANVIAELVNSNFEHLLFKEVRRYLKEYDAVLQEALNEGYVEPAEIHLRPGFFLIKEIDLLTSLAQDNIVDYHNGFLEFIGLCKEANNIDKADIIRIRLARSIVHKEIDQAFRYFKESADSLIARGSNEKKWILLAEFEMNIIKVQNGRSRSMKDLILSHQRLKKNFYNDYRKAYLAVAACYLLQAMNEKAYDYLHRDFFTKREMRPRLKGMRLQLLALYEFYQNNNKILAEEYLLEQKKMFSALGESYHKIIEHNLSMLNSFLPQNVTLSFFQESDEVKQTMYIDPRLW